MKLGDTGEAFFVEEVENENEQATIPAHLATSPIPNEIDTDYLENEINKLKFKYNLDKENTVASDGDAESESETCKTLVKDTATETNDIQAKCDIKNSLSSTHPFPESNFDLDQTLHDTQETLISILDQTEELFDDTEKCKSIAVQTEDTIVSDSDNDKKLQTSSFSSLFSKKRRRKKSSIKRPGRSSSKDSLIHLNNQFDSREQNEEVFHMEDDWEDDNNTIVAEDNISNPLSSGVSTFTTSNNKINSKQQCTTPSHSDIHPYSDGEMTPFFGCSPKTRRRSRPPTPKSDTEYEISRNDATSQTESEEVSWEWGELPHVQKKISLTSNVNSTDLEYDNVKSNENKKVNEAQSEVKTSVLEGVLSFIKTKDESNKVANQPDSEKGIFLDDLNPEDLDPGLADLYFPKLKSNMPLKGPSLDDDVESGNGSSIPHSPQLTSNSQLSSDSEMDQEKMILGSCDTNMIANILKNIAISSCGGLEDDTISSEKFNQSLITYEDFCAKPLEVLKNTTLVFRINGRYYNWASAAPIILSLILYNRPLPIHSINSIIDQTMTKKKELESKSSWWYWRRSASSPKVDDTSLNENKDIEVCKVSVDENEKLDQSKLSDNTVSTTVQTSDMEIDDMDNDYLSKSDIEDCEVIIINKNNNNTKNPNVQYRKVLRISSEQIENLNLVEGRNEVVFSVTTAYQGTTRCKCHIYLWRHDDKIIVSDIDGTITKSDILGHILPVIGKDWAQSGVANLFDKIKENGYKLLYLSARAIGQARLTREYLKSVRQGNICLPDGPLLLSPTSLISAFHR